MSKRFDRLLDKLIRKSDYEYIRDKVYAICESKDALIFVAEDIGMPSETNYQIMEYYKKERLLSEPICDGNLLFCVGELERMAEDFKTEVEYL